MTTASEGMIVVDVAADVAAEVDVDVATGNDSSVSIFFLSPSADGTHADRPTTAAAPARVMRMCERELRMMSFTGKSQLPASPPAASLYDAELRIRGHARDHA